MRLILRWLAVFGCSLALSQSAFAQSLSEMAGQMILVGFQGDSVNDAGVVAVQDDIATGRIGGVMFLRTNVSSLAAVGGMNRGFAAAAPDLPPFIAIDQEGGLVERLTEAVGFNEIPSAKQMVARGSADVAETIYRQMANGLRAAGFNLNFGPVVDLDINPNNPVIGKFGRAFSADPAVVVDYAEAFVRAHHQAGVLTALKHFPGHGSSATDSHEGFTDISSSWKEVELDPYKALIADDLVDMVMAGHLYQGQFDAMTGGEKLPASLSPMWIEQTLRRGLGFDGVVVSDDMEMGAIRQHYSLADSVKRAVWAGSDILLFSNTADARTTLASEVLAILVQEGEANPEFARRIAQSYARIVALKQTL